MHYASRSLDQLLNEGWIKADLPPGTIEDGYAVLTKDDSVIAIAADGAKSSYLGTVESGCSWCQQYAFRRSDSYPNVGELWGYAGRTAIICGNSISENKTIWVMDWHSGAKAHAPVHLLETNKDRCSLTSQDIVSRFEEWARNGNNDAMWWLAWWFEGTNHPKSVWYYVAALRADPAGYDWAYERIADDARCPCMCKDVPMPDLAFLKEIPEINGRPIGRDWAQAVKMAETAIHLPADNQGQPQNVYKLDHQAPAD